MTRVVERPRRRTYSEEPLGVVGANPSITCLLDLHLNCRGTRGMGRTLECSCECHVDDGEYR